MLGFMRECCRLGEVDRSKDVNEPRQRFRDPPFDRAEVTFDRICVVSLVHVLDERTSTAQMHQE